MRRRSFILCKKSPQLYFIGLVFLVSLLFICQPSSAASIKLAWDPNSESDLAGYKIYYGTSARTGTDPKSCGLCGYSTVVSAGNVTTYTISNLTSGQNYYFSVTARDTSSNESGFSNEVSGTAGGSTQSLTVALTTGWNLISFPTLSGSTSISQVLSSISGQYERAYTYKGCDATDQWKMYDPAVPAYVNDLQYVDRTMGLWVKASQDTELVVSGSYPTTSTIYLCTGWNLISYTGSQSRPITEALSSISGEYERVYCYKASDASDHWKVYDPSAPSYANDLTTLEPGLGYWIKVTGNCTLTFSQ